MPLTISSELRSGGTSVFIRAEGSIDAITFPVAAKEVEEALQKSPGLIIFDLSRLDYISSAGIGVVLGAEKALKKTGGKALILNPKPQVKKVFDIVQALPRERIFGSVEELDKYLAELRPAAPGKAPGREEFRIQNRMSELDTLAAGIGTFCLSAGMSAGEVAEIRLALEEAVSNTIRHGYGDDQPHEIIVRAAVDGGRLKLEIEDDAKAFDPLAAPMPDLTLPVEEKRIGGLGILLVRTIADSVEYQREGSRNLLRIARWI